VDPAHHDGAVLERLAEALDRGARELGHLVEEQHADVRERDLAGLRRAPAAEQRALEMVWCGARNGRSVTSPHAEHTFVVSSASPYAISGSTDGIRRASIFLP
jgi:hypothetical protein